MSHCGECGQQVHPHQLTCGSCGASLRDDRPPRPPPAGDLEKPDERETFRLDDPVELGYAERVEPTQQLRPEDTPPSATGPATTPRSRRRRRVRAHTRGPVSSPAFFSRAWALVVDAMLLAVACSALPTIAWLGIRAAEAVGGTTELYDDVLTEQLTTLGEIALVASYFVFMNAGAGQTLGTGLKGLHVVRGDGQPPDALQSLVRLVGYVFSALPIGFGFLLAAFTPRRALHDYLAGTIVVRPRDMPGAASEDV